MEHVTASYLTLSGSVIGEPAKHNLVERSKAAAKHGFTGIGACADELEGLGHHTMSAIAAVLPVPVMELEWFDIGQPTRHCAKTLFDAADAFGARRVNVGVCYDWSPRKGITVLRHFAEEALTHLLDVAVEPVAFGPLWDPNEVMALIDAVGMPNVGLLLDTWHMTYAMRDSQVSFVTPWERVTEVQLAGSYRQGHARKDAMQRCLPGHQDDEAQTVSWYELLRKHCPQVPVSVEVTSRELRAHEPGMTAALVMDALNDVEMQARKEA